eukprot:m.246174 g.246174  ORF g.246174 m.246174 type:complete len:126 (+) comp40259_c1_seq1:1651-2028(+)
MFLTEAKYCDFVLWTCIDSVVVRVLPNTDFMADVTSKVIRCSLLPELLGKWYTREKIPEERLENDTSEDLTSYCYCHQERDEEMIGCDNGTCLHQWYHLSCVRLSTVPSGKWLCPECKSSRPKHI